MQSRRYSAVGRLLSSLLKSWGLALVLLVCVASADAQRSDIHTSDEYLRFIRAIAVQTALAETSTSEVVKLLLLGPGGNGEVLVLKLGLLTGNAHAHTDEFSAGLNVALIAHVHHRGMKQAPRAEDSLAVRQYGIPNIVISSDGERIWEVGVVADRDVYREVGASGVGDWQDIE